MTLERDRLERTAQRLAWATIGYNSVEGVIAVGAGLAAGSTALLSFGMDSGIEVMSAVAISWQFRRAGSADRERATLRLIAVAFFALAAYVAVGTIGALVSRSDPDSSPVGIALAASSVVVMPALVWAKRRVGRELGSASVLADSTQTMLCTYLSAVLLLGLVVNAVAGWGWADAAAALVIAAIAAREGLAAWRGDSCCSPQGSPDSGECRQDCCLTP